MARATEAVLAKADSRTPYGLSSSSFDEMFAARGARRSERVVRLRTKRADRRRCHHRQVRPGVALDDRAGDDASIPLAVEAGSCAGAYAGPLLNLADLKRTRTTWRT